MTTQTPATAEIEKWLRFRVRFFPNFWLRVQVRKKNAESCRSSFRIRSHLWFITKDLLFHMTQIINRSMQKSIMQKETNFQWKTNKWKHNCKRIYQ